MSEAIKSHNGIPLIGIDAVYANFLKKNTEEKLIKNADEVSGAIPVIKNISKKVSETITKEVKSAVSDENGESNKESKTDY